MFHYRAIATPVCKESDLLTPYIRHHGVFTLKRTRYRLDTVWNISDFDSLSWRLQLLGDMLDREARSGRMLFWAPGQGHLPQAVCGRSGARPKSIILAGRDRLQLLISQANLETAGLKCPIRVVPLAAVELLGEAVEPKSVDVLVTDLDPVPRTDWAKPLRETAKAILAPGGCWAAVGRSSDMAMLSKSTSGFTPTNDRRNRGWRALVLQRNR